MPSFLELTKHVIDFFDPAADAPVMAAFEPWLADPEGANVPLDQIFNLLHQEYGEHEVNALVTDRLVNASGTTTPGREHGLLKRVSTNQRGVPQIVTTNFDRLFELEGDQQLFHVPPAFPDLAIGTTLEGITYLHGRLVEPGEDFHNYVLSSANFGRAYLSEGWATRFIRSLLEKYTVVLIGYQAEDPPIKYLLQGLNHDSKYGGSSLYAFDRGAPEDIEVKWRDRGVTSIPFDDYPALWRTIEAWAERSDDPRSWRSSVVAGCVRDPKVLSAHERGQVAHVLRTSAGAKLFSQAEPAPHPEWLCVFDATCRTAQACRGYGHDAETFVPIKSYGIDDDSEEVAGAELRTGVVNDSLLLWRQGDANPTESHRLVSRRAEGFEATPPRLGHLILWISKSTNHPVVAWWAARQASLHPVLRQQIERRLLIADEIKDRARHFWNLILESQGNASTRGAHGDWYDLKKRIEAEDWSPSVLRGYTRVANPRIEIGLPLGLARHKPPSASWDEVLLSHLGHFEIKFLDRHQEELPVPDEVLLQVFAVKERHLAVASGLLADIGRTHHESPSPYSFNEKESPQHPDAEDEELSSFVQFFDRLSELNPDLARAHAIKWPIADRSYFRQLKLYAFAQPKIFDAEYVVDTLLGYGDEIFWDTHVSREVVTLLTRRWSEFSPLARESVIERILSGPGKHSDWSDDDYPRIRSEMAARYGRYLQLEGCDFSEAKKEQLAKTLRQIPQWSDDRARSIAVSPTSGAIAISTDDKPDAIADLPPRELISKALEFSGRDFDSFTEKRPFAGLVKANPRKALAALSIAARKDKYPVALWDSMIAEVPSEISPRLRRVLLERLCRLPLEVICSLRDTLPHWVRENLSELVQFNEVLAWRVFDHIVTGLFDGGAETTESFLGEVVRAGRSTTSSRRTFAHAINSPIGRCVEALCNVLSSKSLGRDSGIPKEIRIRLERLLTCPGEGADHAVAILASKLHWFAYIDAGWADERLCSLLVIEHPYAEPAWSGFSHSNREPAGIVAELVKPNLLAVYPWVEGLFWDRDSVTKLATWLSWMRIFRPDQSDGLTEREMRSALRSMSDASRNQVIAWLRRVGQGNEDGWAELVVPFVGKDWPRERKLRTSASTGAWISLLDATGDSFPEVYSAVKVFLSTADWKTYPFHGFVRGFSDGDPMSVRFPEISLDLMNTVTPEVPSSPLYELPEILSLIAEAAPQLTADARYLRLIDLIESS